MVLLEIADIRTIKVCPKCNSSQIRYRKSLRNWICNYKEWHSENKVVRSFKKPKEREAYTTNKKKRNPKNMDIASYHELVEKIRKLDSKNTMRDKALIAFLYLTGARVSEIVRRVRKYQIEKVVLGKDETPYMLVENVVTLKRKDSLKRPIPIPVLNDTFLAKTVADYLDKIDHEDFLFDIDSNWAFKIVKKHRVKTKNDKWVITLPFSDLQILNNQSKAKISKPLTRSLKPFFDNWDSLLEWRSDR